MVGEIVFFIDGQDFFACEVLARDAIEQEGFRAGGEVP